MKRNKFRKSDFKYLEKYYQKDGNYILPIEIVNELITTIEDKDAEIKELNDSVTWWHNRYNAVTKRQCLDEKKG